MFLVNINIYFLYNYVNIYIYKYAKEISEISPGSPGCFPAPVCIATRDAAAAKGLDQGGPRSARHEMRVATMEQAEVTDATTLKTLRRAAEALDCVLVYALVPRTSLKQTLQKQARREAEHDMARASRTMALEDQALARDEVGKTVETAAAALLDKMPKSLWD